MQEKPSFIEHFDYDADPIEAGLGRLGLPDPFETGLHPRQSQDKKELAQEGEELIRRLWRCTFFPCQ